MMRIISLFNAIWTFTHSPFFNCRYAACFLTLCPVSSNICSDWDMSYQFFKNGSSMTHSVCQWNESIWNWQVKLSLVQLMKSCNSVGPAALARVAIIHSGWKGWLHNCMCGTISLSRREEWGSGCFCCCPGMSRSWAWRQLAWYIPRPQTGPLLGVPDLIMYIVAQTSWLDRFRDENSSLRIHQRQAGLWFECLSRCEADASWAWINRTTGQWSGSIFGFNFRLAFTNASHMTIYSAALRHYPQFSVFATYQQPLTCGVVIMVS